MNTVENLLENNLVAFDQLKVLYLMILGKEPIGDRPILLIKNFPRSAFSKDTIFRLKLAFISVYRQQLKKQFTLTLAAQIVALLQAALDKAKGDSDSKIADSVKSYLNSIVNKTIDEEQAQHLITLIIKLSKYENQLNVLTDSDPVLFGTTPPNSFSKTARELTKYLKLLLESTIVKPRFEVKRVGSRKKLLIGAFAASLLAGYVLFKPVR